MKGARPRKAGSGTGDCPSAMRGESSGGGPFWAKLTQVAGSRTVFRSPESHRRKDAQMLSSARIQQRLARRSMALVLAGGRGSRLKQLTDRRAKPAVFFGGKFRIIDFALSNCINSGVRRIGILSQYKAHSLLRH